MRHTVLIIDDDPLLVTLQKKLTQRIGPVDVAHADDGFQALHFLAEIEPDIVFFDIDMPGLDGWLLCEILHKVDRWAHIPIILQSALVGEENIKRGLSSRRTRSYIEKPFTEDKLRQVLERYLPQEEDEAAADDTLAALPPLVQNLAQATVQVLNLVTGTHPTVTSGQQSELGPGRFRVGAPHSVRASWERRRIGRDGGSKYRVVRGIRDSSPRRPSDRAYR